MELEALLRSAKTADQLHVCADLLLEAGEVQGEVMAAHLGGQRLRDREDHLERLARRVLGGEEDDERLQFEWRDGFVTTVIFRGWGGFPFIADTYLELASLLETPPSLVPAMRWTASFTWSERVRVWRLLCRLDRLHVAPWASSPDYSSLWDLISSLGSIDSVRHLITEDFPERDEHQLTWVEAGDLSATWPELARLETLRIRGSRPGFGAIDAPALRSFELETSTLTEVDSFLSARWPRLERFSICFHDGRYAEHQCTLSDALSVVAALPPTVHVLGLRNAPFTEGLLEALAGSPRLATLTELDVSSGVLLDGAAVLERHAAAFRHLRRLDASDTGLVVHDRLRAELPGLVVANRRGPKLGRYVSLSE